MHRQSLKPRSGANPVKRRNLTIRKCRKTKGNRNEKEKRGRVLFMQHGYSSKLFSLAVRNNIR